MTKSDSSSDLLYFDMNELLRRFWDRRWMLAMFLALGVLVSLTLILLDNHRQYSFFFRMLPATENGRYVELNTSLKRAIQASELERDIQASELERDIQASDLKTIKYESDNTLDTTRESLLLDFLETLNSTEFIFEQIVSSGLLSREDGESAAEFTARLNEEASYYSVTPIFGADKITVESYSFELRLPTDIDGLDFGQKLVANATEQARADRLVDLNSQIDSLQTHRDFELLDVAERKELAKSAYSQLTKQKLAHLNEQAQLARIADIENGPIVFEPRGKNPLKQLEAKSTLTYQDYFRGYKLIEKEIELVEARQDAALFIPDLVELEVEEAKLKNNLLINWTRGVLDKSPLSTGEFSSIDFSSQRYGKRRIYHPVLIIVSMLTFSLLLGAAMVPILDARKPAKSNKA